MRVQSAVLTDLWTHFTGPTVVADSAQPRAASHDRFMGVRHDVLTDLFARVFIGALFTVLSVNLLGDFLRTGRLTGLLLLVNEALVVVFTVARRPARLVNRSAVAGLMTVLSMSGPYLLRAGSFPGWLPDRVTVIVSGLGLALVIVGKVALGRSFGIAPANRGIVAWGPYNIVRHPIYAGYLITHIAFVVAHPRLLNIVIIAVADTALVLRALIEERVLRTDQQYETYCQRVSWHLVPGIF
jgi:protein-S-isoprenylcysteine O-methyltransferase Ste14